MARNLFKILCLIKPTPPLPPKNKLVKSEKVLNLLFCMEHGPPFLQKPGQEWKSFRSFSTGLLFSGHTQSTFIFKIL